MTIPAPAVPIDFGRVRAGDALTFRAGGRAAEETGTVTGKTGKTVVVRTPNGTAHLRRAEWEGRAVRHVGYSRSYDASYEVEIPLGDVPTLTGHDGASFVPDKLSVRWLWRAPHGWERCILVTGWVPRDSGNPSRKSSHRFETPATEEERRLPAWVHAEADKVPAPHAVPFPT
ncbi:hypothetical protein [Planomonospora algeriensis]